MLLAILAQSVATNNINLSDGRREVGGSFLKRCQRCCRDFMEDEGKLLNQDRSISPTIRGETPLVPNFQTAP